MVMNPMGSQSVKNHKQKHKSKVFSRRCKHKNSQVFFCPSHLASSGKKKHENMMSAMPLIRLHLSDSTIDSTTIIGSYMLCSHGCFWSLVPLNTLPETSETNSSHPNMKVGIRSFPFGMAYFQGLCQL